MPTVVGSGDQTATISTEHTLDTEVTNGTFALAVDTANMVAGDTVELRFYQTPKSAATERLVYVAQYTNGQEEPLKLSPPVPSPVSCRVTLKQTAGTGRVFPWALYAL